MKIGDLVSRNKYHNDIIFRIVKIENGVASLCGEYVRLVADSPLDDLKIETETFFLDEVEIETNRDNKMINGSVLHLDGDEKYLKRCLELYKKYDVPSIGYFMKEKEMPNQITNLLIKHKPDILIITGHDNYKLGHDNIERFENSEYFISSVKKARIYQPSKDALVIFAGACQSYYEALIESGANFASSPNRKNINVLDPTYIAISIARENVRNYIDIKETLKKTVSKGVGLGGVDTKGVARRLY